MSCIVEVFEVGEPEEILGEANRDLEGKLAAIGVLLDAHVSTDAVLALARLTACAMK